MFSKKVLSLVTTPRGHGSFVLGHCAEDGELRLKIVAERHY
jgi:hypothetical protein